MRKETKKIISWILILAPIPLFVASGSIADILYSYILQDQASQLPALLSIFFGFSLIVSYLLSIIAKAGIIIGIPVGVIWFLLLRRSERQADRPKLKKENTIDKMLTPLQIALLSVPFAFLGFGALSNAYELFIEGPRGSTMAISSFLTIFFFGTSWAVAYKITKNSKAIFQLIMYQVIVSIISWILV